MVKPAALLVCAIVVGLTSCKTDPSRPNGRHRQPVNSTTIVTPQPLPDAAVTPALAGSAGTSATTGCPVSVLPIEVASDAGIGELRVFRMFYGTGRTEFRVPTAMEAELLEQAKNATRIVVKGRTDGQSYAPGDEQVALNRALSARRFLIEHGVDPTRIDIQFASAADYLTENTSDAGRAQNRRVAIELELPRTSIASL